MQRTMRSGRGRGRTQPPTPRLPLCIRAVILLIAAGLVALIGLRVRQRDALTQWRQSLELRGERVEWPAWDPEWPPLPLNASQRKLPLDLTGPAAYVARNADAMRHIPCFCGSCPADHHSNLSCYVTGFSSDGKPLWTDHASTCPICIRITREVMLMTHKGWPLEQIRETLDREYTSAGHRRSTATPYPPVATPGSQRRGEK